MTTILYPRVSDDYLQTVLDKSTINDTYPICYNLSAVLGDVNALLSMGTAKLATNGLFIVSPDIVVVEGGVNIPANSLPPVEYNNNVSDFASEIYFSIVNNTDEYIEPNTTEIYSNMLLLSKKHLSGLPLVVSKSVYLDSYALYLSLINTTASTGITDMTKTDIDVLDNNLRWLGAYIETMTEIPYDLLTIVRDLHRAVINTRNSKIFFSSTFASKRDPIYYGRSES